MSLVDTYISYRLVKLLSTQFEKWEAFKLGIIDKEGNVLKKPETSQEKKAYSTFEKIIKNIKRAITKLTGHSRAAAILSTLIILKEYQLPILGYIIKEDIIMPAELVKTLSKKVGISKERGERLWDKAKKIVQQEYPDVEIKSKQYYALVVGVLKRSMGLTEESLAANLPIIDQPMMRFPDGVNNGIHYFNVDMKDTNIPNILNGRERYKRWREYIKDKKIHMWANRYFKPFSIRTQNGTFFRIR